MSHDESTELSESGSPFDWRRYTRRLRRHPVLRAWRRSSQQAKHFVPFMWRRATQNYRQLPSAVIAGAQKAGTTQLFAYLIKHPRVLPGSSKEIDYFSRHAEKSVEWYRSRFPLQRNVSQVDGHVLEASPSYLCTPAAIPRMRSVLPDARIIVVLRDPVSRAFSGYQHAKTRRRDLRPFETAIADELQKSFWRPRFGQALRPGVPNMRGYLMRGYYALQIELILAHYRRDQVLLLDSADLFADTNASCQRVFEFLGVEPFEVSPEKVYNRGYYEERIDPRTAERLREHYRPFDQMLSELTGRRFSWMNEAVLRRAA